MIWRVRLHASLTATAALLTGCLGNSALRPQPPAPLPDTATSGAPVPASNYQVRVVEPAAPQAAPVEQVRYPVPAPAPEPVAKPVEPPREPEPLLVQVVRLVLEGRTRDAAELLRRLDSTSRDLLLALLRVAIPLGDGGLESASPQDAAALLEQVNHVQASLRERAPLGIEKMCFCREIRDFGRYTPLPPDYAFQAGSDGLPGELVQVYVEVRNVLCRPRGTAYETSLKGHVEIYDFRGKCVWQHDFDNRPDRSRTPLQDNYVEFHFNVPAELAADSAYTLWVYVKDVEEEGIVKVARRSLDFRVRTPHRSGSPVVDSARP